MPAATLRYCAAACLTVLLGSSFASQHAFAQAATPTSEQNKIRLTMRSYLGSYLAGRIARGASDTSHAVSFYRKALRRTPDSQRLIERAFLMEATEGNWTEAVASARNLIRKQSSHRLARMLLGVHAFREGKLKLADRHFELSQTGPIGELTASIARAWIALALDNKKAAFRHFKRPKQADWSDFYLRYHRALMSDIVGDQKAARSNYTELFGVDARTPRTAMAYIRHAVRHGNFRLAGQTARQHIRQSSSGGHASVQDLFKKIKAGTAMGFLITKPDEGLAEVFYGLGEALTSEGGVNLGTVYLQLALAIRPDFPFAQAALANVYESTKRYDRAIETYNNIGRGTPLQAAIDIRKAINLDSMDRVDEAKVVLDRLAKQRPKDIRPLEALGNILRGRKRYREAIGYYSRLIKLLPNERKRYWTYWYARGTCYERIKDWPNAEKDLVKAMDLDPDQALVLNYLGYSWVDQKVHLGRGLKLIERAVSLRPDDGYIVDSLGWAHYRLGNFGKAVKYLERAVELRPEDPVLNDHLGDALWRAERTREARYQWELALTLKPEEKDAVKIRRKLVVGLPLLTRTNVDNGKKQPAKPQGLGKRADSQVDPAVTAPLR